MEEENAIGDFLPEQDIATLSQITTLIIGEPVSVSQVNQALKKVTSQEEEQDNSESSADDSEVEEEEEEGAVGSVVIRRRNQTFQKEVILVSLPQLWMIGKKYRMWVGLGCTDIMFASSY